jgi:hypothetical protein
VLNAREFVADGGLNTQFFIEFASQGIARLLPFFDLPAGELPFERHSLMPRSLTDEQLAILHD